MVLSSRMTLAWLQKKKKKKDVIPIFNGTLLSHLRKEWNNATTCNMGGSRDYHTKWSKSDKHKWNHLYAESKKMTQVNLLIKQNHEGRNKCMVNHGGGGAISWEVEVDTDTLLL